MSTKQPQTGFKIDTINYADDSEHKIDKSSAADSNMRDYLN